MQKKHTYNDAEIVAKEAFYLCLKKEVYSAQELLLRTHNTLKQLSGDLPIVSYDMRIADYIDTPFATQSIAEARAWSWFEIASGVFKLIEDHPGASMVHFKRAWRIWRTWGTAIASSVEEQHEARYERVRAGLWLGEAWARFMSDRAESNAQAVLRASLTELERLKQPQLLYETIVQQRHLPLALPGTPAYQEDKQNMPYVCIVNANKEKL
ncbi:MAG: hypothetical protein NVS4B12_21160 [Ktedonobacteraceae bacterium]